MYLSIYMCVHVFGYLYLCNCPLGRVFANGLVDWGSILGRVIPKTLKMVLDTSLLNTRYYKVDIKGKGEQSRVRSSALGVVAIEKGAFGLPSTTVANFTYFTSICWIVHIYLQKYTNNFVNCIIEPLYVRFIYIYIWTVCTTCFNSIFKRSLTGYTWESCVPY